MTDIVLNGNAYGEASFEGANYADPATGLLAFALDLLVHNATIASSSSTTTLTIAPGSHTLFVQNYKFFPVNIHINIVDAGNSANNMYGVVTAHDPVTGQLTFSATSASGVGTISDWLVSVAWEDIEAIAATINQPLGTGNTPEFAGMNLTGDLTVYKNSAGIYLACGGSDDGGSARRLELESRDVGAFLGAEHSLNASSGSGVVVLKAGSNEVARFDSNRDVTVHQNIFPSVAGVGTCGTALAHFDTVFATNFTTVSDSKLKTESSAYTFDNLIDVLRQTDERLYTMNDKTLPAEQQRRHKKIVVKKQGFKIEVVDGKAIRKAVTIEEEEPAFNVVPLFNEDGSPVLNIHGDQMMHKEPVFEDIPGHDQVVKHKRIHSGWFADEIGAKLQSLNIDWGFHIYDEKAQLNGLRETEALPVIVHWLKKLESRIEALEAR